jgi:hypothetical protein
MANLRRVERATAVAGQQPHNPFTHTVFAMANSRQDIIELTDLRSPAGVFAPQPAGERIPGFLDEAGDINAAAGTLAVRTIDQVTTALVHDALEPAAAMRMLAATWAILSVHAFRVGGEPHACFHVSPAEVAAGLADVLEPAIVDMFLHACQSQNIMRLVVPGEPVDTPPELTNALDAASDRVRRAAEPETLRQAIADVSAARQRVVAFQRTCPGAFEPTHTPLALAALTNAVPCFMVGERAAEEGEVRLGSLMGVMVMAARVAFGRAGLVRAVAWPADETYTCEFEARDVADAQRRLVLPRERSFGRYSACHFFGYVGDCARGAAVVHLFVSQMLAADDFDGDVLVFVNTISGGDGRLVRRHLGAQMDAEERLRHNDCRLLSGLMCSVARVPPERRPRVLASDMELGTVDACTLWVVARMFPGTYGDFPHTDQRLLDPAWDGIVTESAWHQDREFPVEPADVEQAIRAQANSIVEFVRHVETADPGHFLQQQDEEEDEETNNNNNA